MKAKHLIGLIVAHKSSYFTFGDSTYKKVSAWHRSIKEGREGVKNHLNLCYIIYGGSLAYQKV